MEITESTVYWITRMDSIHIFLTVFYILSGVLAAFSFILFFATFMVCNGIEGKEKEFYSAMKLELKTFFTGIISFIIIFLISVFIPTTKEMALIKVLPAISNSRFVSEELPKEAGEIYMLAKEALKEKLVGEKK